MGFVRITVFNLGVFLLKFSLLALYNELIPATERKLRIAVTIVTIYCVVCFLITTFLDIFWCGADITLNW
jgi:hypothetical protein